MANVPDQKPRANVPDQKPRSVANVPDTQPRAKNVPATKPPARPTAAPSARPARVAVGDAFTPINQRPYNGGKLGVKVVGKVVELDERVLDLATVDGRSRVRDRTPWTGYEIVEL